MRVRPSGLVRLIAGEPFGHGVLRQRSVGHDVVHCASVASGQVGDHASVAAPPGRLAAHDGDVAGVGILQQSPVCRLKTRSADVPCVVGERLILPPVVPRYGIGRRFASSTKVGFVPVVDPCGPEPVRHDLFGHVGVTTGAGKASHVDEQCDVVLAKRGSELFGGFGTVADGVQHLFIVALPTRTTAASVYPAVTQVAPLTGTGCRLTNQRSVYESAARACGRHKGLMTCTF